MDRWTIQELAEAVNAWCRDREVQPANGQAASELSVRTLHYYRGSGLLDAPESGGGADTGVGISSNSQRSVSCKPRACLSRAFSNSSLAARTRNWNKSRRARKDRPSDADVVLVLSRRKHGPHILLAGKSSWWLAEGRRGYEPPARSHPENLRTPLTRNSRKHIDVMNTQRIPTAAFGLVAWLEQTRIHLPLKAIDCRFRVIGAAVDVEIDQVFHQSADRPLDVTYSFPLPSKAAVYRCEMMNSHAIRAKVVEQEAAGLVNVTGVTNRPSRRPGCRRPCSEACRPILRGGSCPPSRGA